MASVERPVSKEFHFKLCSCPCGEEGFYGLWCLHYLFFCVYADGIGPPPYSPLNMLNVAKRRRGRPTRAEQLARAGFMSSPAMWPAAPPAAATAAPAAVAAPPAAPPTGSCVGCRLRGPEYFLVPCHHMICSICRIMNPAVAAGRCPSCTMAGTPRPIRS